MDKLILAIFLLSLWMVSVNYLHPKLHEMAPPLSDCTGTGSLANAMFLSTFLVIFIEFTIMYFIYAYDHHTTILNIINGFFEAMNTGNCGNNICF